jgi:hypothetical protein
MVGNNNSYFNILKNNGKYIVIRLETEDTFNSNGIGLTQFVYSTSPTQPLQYQKYEGKDTNYSIQIIIMGGASGTYLMKLDYTDNNSNKISLTSDLFTQ